MRRLALAAAAALLAAGCAAEPAGTAAEARPAQTAAGSPVEVQNCGRTLRFEEPPQRIVSGWPSSTELLIALGAQEQVVGKYNTASGTPSAEYRERYDAVPTLAENAPSREALLATKPDLIWADGSYLFDGQQLPTIEQLAEQGTQVMILSGFCTDDATKATIADLDTDLAALGRVLGREDRAAELKADADRRLQAVQQRVGAAEPVPVAMIGSYDGTLYAYEGVYTDMARLAGGRNVYSGVLPRGSYYGEVSSEDLTRRNPPTIVYLTQGAETEAQAREYLTRTFPTVEAVRANRVVVIPQTDATNLRGIAGVEALAASLHPSSP